jgi:hypothetical protein
VVSDMYAPAVGTPAIQYRLIGVVADEVAKFAP